MTNYDEIIIQLNKNGESQGRIKMSTEHIGLLMETHKQELGDVLELMVKTIDSEITAKSTDSDTAKNTTNE
jgi:hypothetical protein